MYNIPLAHGQGGGQDWQIHPQLSRDSAACHLKKVRWTNYNILICINTLRGSDKDKAKLAERLTLLYNTHCEAGTAMTLATVHSEVKKFWRTIKETRELTYRGTASAGGN